MYFISTHSLKGNESGKGESYPSFFWQQDILVIKLQKTLKVLYLCKHSSKLFGKKKQWEVLKVYCHHYFLLSFEKQFQTSAATEYFFLITTVRGFQMLSEFTECSLRLHPFLRKRSTKRPPKEAAVQRLCQQALLAFLISINTEEHYHTDVLFLFSPLT